MFPKREICIALLLSIAIISPVSARFSDGFKTNDCSDAPIQHQAFTRAIQSLCSLDNEDVMYLVQLARSTHKSARENLYQSLEYRLKPAGSFDVQDFAEIWVTISKLNLPINNVRDHMASLASGHVNLANSLHQSPVLHTGIQASREQAAAVLKNQPPDVYLARGTLSNALETLLNELSSLPAGDQLRELKFARAPVIAQLFRDLAWLEESEPSFMKQLLTHCLKKKMPSASMIYPKRPYFGAARERFQGRSMSLRNLFGFMKRSMTWFRISNRQFNGLWFKTV